MKAYAIVVIAGGESDSKEFENISPGTKEALLHTISSKDFGCCPSHAMQLFPSIVDDLHALGLITTEEAYASNLVSDDVPFAIAKSLKELDVTDDELLQEAAKELRYQLGCKEYSLGEKESQALKTINQKIATLPGPVASQVRQASTQLKESMLASAKRRAQAIRDIPDDVWEEAAHRDELENQPEGLDVVQQVVQEMVPGIKGGPGSGNYGHAGRPGLVGGSGGRGVDISKAPSATLKGGNIADHNLTWECEEAIKGQIIVEHDEDEPSNEKLASFIKKQFSGEELVRNIYDEEDIEKVDILSVEHGKGYSVVQVDVTPTVEAGDLWLEEAGGEEQWTTYHEM